MSHVFVSYSHDDEDRAFGLESRLRNKGINTYIDAPALDPGDEWRAKLKEGLDNAYAVVVVCTKNAMESHEVTFEWSYAMGLDIPVIPVIYESDAILHSRLSTLQNINFVDSRHRNWNELFQVLQDSKLRYQPTKGFLGQAGIRKITFSRNELGDVYSVSRILDALKNSAELIVIARSCEAWAREYLELETAINGKNVNIHLAMVKPTLPKERWMIPSDYAQLDTAATLDKLKMIKVRTESTGSLELIWLPSSPLFSFVYFSSGNDLSTGILEAGASLSLSERTSLILSSDNRQQGILLQRIYKIHKRVLDEGEKALALRSQALMNDEEKDSGKAE